MATSSAASSPASRPVHPCVMSVTGGARGVEFSTWAERLDGVDSSSSSSSSLQQQQQQPWLVTAAASTIGLYQTVRATTATPNDDNHAQQSGDDHRMLRLVDTITVAGAVCFLATLSSPYPYPDALVMGWAGAEAPRLSVVQYNRNGNGSNAGKVNSASQVPTAAKLQTCALIDLMEWQAPHHGMSAVGQDTVYALHQEQDASSKSATLVAILDGGSRIALASLQFVVLPDGTSSWNVVTTPQPYALPLHELAHRLPTYSSRADASAAAVGTFTTNTGAAAGDDPENENTHENTASHTKKIYNYNPTGWGEIWYATFLEGTDRVDDQLVLLHAPGGRVAPERLTPPDSGDSNAAATTFVTCVACHANQGRAAWLWTTAVPADAMAIHAVPTVSSYNSSSTSMMQPGGCIVQCVNAILRVGADGTLLQSVAVNGWARTTYTGVATLSSSGPQLQVNPAVPLSIALDGATWTWWWCNNKSNNNKSNNIKKSNSSHEDDPPPLRVALVVLRTGHVYVWQPIPPTTTTAATTIEDKSSNSGKNGTTGIIKSEKAPPSKAISTATNAKDMIWTLVPTGHVLDGMGQVAHASRRVCHVVEKNTNNNNTNTALWLVGSRLGDSHLVAINGQALTPTAASASIIPNNESSKLWEKLTAVAAPTIIKEDDNIQIKADEMAATVKQEPGVESTTTIATAKAPVTTPNDAYEAMLLAEEDALYGDSLANVIENDDALSSSSSPLLNHRDKRRKESVAAMAQQFPWLRLQDLKIADTLINLGPLGGATTGPIAAVAPCLRRRENAQALAAAAAAASDDPQKAAAAAAAATTTPTTAHVVPCGFGNSGGVAWATLPGRDDRMLLAEDDLMGVQALFGLPGIGLVIMAMEVDEKNTNNGKPSIRVLQVQTTQHDELSEIDTRAGSYWAQALPWIASGNKRLLHAHECAANQNSFVLLTEEQNVYEYFLLQLNKAAGAAQLKILDQGSIPAMGNLRRVTAFSQPQKGVDTTTTALIWDKGETTVWSVSASGDVTSCTVPSTATQAMQIEQVEDNEQDSETKVLQEFYSSGKIVAADVFVAPRSLFDKPKNLVESNSSDAGSATRQEVSSDFDDDDLELYGLLPQSSNRSEGPSRQGPEKDDTPATFVAVCRQSGKLEVYMLNSKAEVSTMVWSCEGASQGFQVLKESIFPEQMARSHKIYVKEMRFFTCGPTATTARGNTRYDALRTFCLAIETSAGDFFLYNCLERGHDIQFARKHFGSISRASLEQGRHRTKLSRKGIIAKDAVTFTPTFQYNNLLSFEGLSGQDGLLAMVPRPFWLVADRGLPCMLFHRTRHGAPAGGKNQIVNGFCMVGSGRFLTIHERVGRVGSQRLTLFKGISKVLQAQGVLGGDGMCFERITLGVTVRHIEFIDDPNISTGDHPLYALLVSREMEVDQSELNDDGMTAEEREKAKKEKEEAKIKRQVEADLGGFDFEHEWVEDITREDAFYVDRDLGGAPPIFKEAYSVWIVDASNKWQVVDSFDLEEYEHGMTLKVMPLSVFREEPGRNNNVEEEEVIQEDLDQTLFVMVGTGTVDYNGEDVTGKGRALLFEVKRFDKGRRSGRVASLQLAYEKEIFHGPVTTLTCLSTDGKNRLILGAGADVNVEQWGNNKLTQVGFFRATMQIADIRIFKNFLLLSDAYDSLHLLVYRESDKSLTLLAKEYEPVAVYAAGLLSRGPSVTFLCHDDRQNVQFLQYAPGESASRGGNKLVCRADYHLGTQTVYFGNHFCRSSLLIHSATPTSTMAALQQQDSYFGHGDDDQRLSVNFGTTDGTVCAVVPLSEPVFWRLAALQSVLANALESDCGLSPRAWRLYRRCARRGGCRSNDRKKSVIDGDLVCRYSDLPVRDQEDLASAVGSTVGAILDNLLELRCGSLMI